ncbi:hypothetical protein GQ600_1928 [Phytophthora cactorum]|nr:hypothetical protein GQ600_1928 [Phytophthora cactorum]
MDCQEERRLLNKRTASSRVPTDDNTDERSGSGPLQSEAPQRGKTYTTRHRDEYEWACREPARVETPEGARLNLFELLGAVDNKPTRIDDDSTALKEGNIVSRPPPPRLRSPKQLSTTRLPRDRSL